FAASVHVTVVSSTCLPEPPRHEYTSRSCGTTSSTSHATRPSQSPIGFERNMKWWPTSGLMSFSINHEPSSFGSVNARHTFAGGPGKSYETSIVLLILELLHQCLQLCEPVEPEGL